MYQDAWDEVNFYLDLILNQTFPQIIPQYEIVRLEQIKEVSSSNFKQGLYEFAVALIQNTLVELKLLWKKVALDETLLLYLQETFTQKFEQTAYELLANQKLKQLPKMVFLQVFY